MKFIPLLSLLFVSYRAVNAYSNCQGCRVILEENGVKWGVENNDWCIVSSSCNKNDPENQCFSFPEYMCCKGCDVVEDDGETTKWGIENNEWCGLKESCYKETTKPYNYNPAIQFKEAPGNYLQRCQQAGKIVKESYNGINGRNSLNVYLPYGYDEKKQYNIFYLMHGGSENENTIFNNEVQLNNILDNMIMKGELEPLIVVTPTFNRCECRTFYKEFRESVIPFVEGKYSTYAKSTSAADIKASRMHRGFGGFSMGSASTWAVFINCLDICAYYMPLSGENWEADGAYMKAKTVADAVDKLGLKKNQYFIFCATGSEDIAYPNMNPMMNEMKKMSQFVYTSDFSKGNFYYLVANGKTHWWGYVRHYIYDALPSFFHEV
ncbi:alpha/beta-hydrolase [Anaeromyces robustus]|jgi:enterochelin esterase-like enzyme|uniref:Alpha/beta-hydrolase n=1 Tax=Anaeromyces robustus TaxID=1754192 RepID=A0A1Y1X5A8_9FUNG|nr:alpha/beta-hydrolase [Anaeromyces robustus]|eukprot:ORX80546.1 alpha/beta-hydrolase [Anaeromyces robustus]